MKIIHICLCGPYNDGWSYQENCLSYYHKKLGYEVSIITTPYINKKEGLGISYFKEGQYIDENNIKVIRIKSTQRGASKIASVFKKYPNLNKHLLSEKPDILFIHGCQFADLITISNYLKKNRNIEVFIDNHADYSNSVSGFFSKYVVHKLIIRYFVKKIQPYVKLFYGVMPARVDFINEMYGVPKSKIDLLLLGAEDEKVQIAEKEDLKESLRVKHGIKPDDFVIVTGGKIDKEKWQTILLMRAVKRIKNNHVKLLIFGSVADELKTEFESLCDNTNVQYIGWIDSQESYNYFAVADLCVFPGRHSVLWEQAVGSGVPGVFKYWNGTTHIDVGGNCKFLYNDTEDEILEIVESIINDKDKYSTMSKIAKNKGKDIFSYKKIAKYSLKENENPYNGGSYG